jgi:glycosyltransferase involved in cell wall biosynthesis
MDQPTLSVIVCTRNRSRLLAEACGAILAVDSPGEPWELLIIDNGSTDDTLDIAHQVAAEDARVRVEVEERLGLSNARNAGIRHARGELLLFVDDDAFPAPGWLVGLAKALRLEDVLAAGGPVEPRFAGELPEWFGPTYRPYVTVWDLGPELVDLHYNEYPRGANMGFRRETFERFGGFSHHLGRTGSSLLSCEETELCLRIERGGGRVVYTPEAPVEHHVDASRITEGWMIDRFGAQGRSEAIVDWQHGGFAGLRWGLSRARRHLEAVRQNPAGPLHVRCQETAYRAYRWSALFCPLRIPRYRPGPEAGEVKPWRPLVRALG